MSFGIGKKKERIQKNTNKFSKNSLNFLTITQRFLKEQIFFYFLATLSFFGSWLITQNALKLTWDKIKDGEIKNEIQWLGKTIYDFKENKLFFSITMAIIVLIYCSIVIYHVYYSIYLENKIVGVVKKKIVSKILALKGAYDKKQILNNLTHDAITFTKNVIHVPNQIFYMILDTIGTFLMMQISDIGTEVLWLGAAYLIAIFLISSFFNFFLYKKDLILQKKLELQIHQEDILVNNRDLIIKKGLSKNFTNQYNKFLQNTRQSANKKDWFFTLAYVVPSYSLIKYANFFFYPFINSPAGWTAFSMLANLFDALKKMLERLKEYPYYFSAKNRLNQLIFQEERDDIQKNILIEEKIEKLNLKDITFSYKKGKIVLKKINLVFQKGKVNNLQGTNGFGKSTINNLIFGLYKPQKGEIFINDNYKLSEINLNEWRKKIAYSEHNNLVENGLSTGQKQLLDLEEIIKDKDNINKEIFIFDEADNALDEENKKKFREKINKISKKKIVILVSH